MREMFHFDYKDSGREKMYSNRKVEKRSDPIPRLYFYGRDIPSPDKIEV